MTVLHDIDAIMQEDERHRPREFSKYAPGQPRDDQGRFATVHRGVASYGDYTDGEAALDDMVSERGSTGVWWGREDEAQFYGDASTSEPMGAYFTGRAHRSQIHETEATGSLVSGDIEITAVHVKTADGWKLLPVKPRRIPTGYLAKYAPGQARVPRGSSSGGQFAAGGSGTGSLADQASAKLQAHFPRARVILDNVEDDALDGMIAAIDRVIEKFPQLRDEVALVRFHERQLYSSPMGEVTVLTVGEVGTTITGLGLELNTAKLNKRSYDKVVEDITIGGAWSSDYGQESYDGDMNWERGNTFDISSHAAFVDSVVTHELGHMVHMLSTAKGAGTSVVDGTGKNQAVWDDVVSDGMTPIRDPDNSALRDYASRANDDIYNNGVIRADDYPLPTLYSRNNTAELFAEAFAIRHGTPGVGTIGGRPLSPELDAIVAKIEDDLRA